MNNQLHINIPPISLKIAYIILSFIFQYYQFILFPLRLFTIYAYVNLFNYCYFDINIGYFRETLALGTAIVIMVNAKYAKTLRYLILYTLAIMVNANTLAFTNSNTLAFTNSNTLAFTNTLVFVTLVDCIILYISNYKINYWMRNIVSEDVSSNEDISSFENIFSNNVRLDSFILWVIQKNKSLIIKNKKRRLLKYIIKKHSIKHTNDECIICRDNLTNVMVDFKCGHSFHFNCIFLTLENGSNRTCPLCRNEI